MNLQDTNQIYHFDYDRVLFALILTLIGVLYFILKREQFDSYKEGALLVAIGIVLLNISVIIGGLIAGHWDSTFIFAVLSLKITDGGGWLSRGPATSGYSLIIFGFTIIVIAKYRRMKKV